MFIRDDARRPDEPLPSTELVSVNTSGSTANYGSFQPSVTPDGRFVAFSSDASDLTTDTDGASQNRDIFVRDRYGRPVTATVPAQLPTTVKLSLPSSCTGANTYGAGACSTATTGTSQAPSISSDGRYVAFQSSYSGLIASGDSNGKTDVFLYDRDADGNGFFDEPGTGKVTTTLLSWATGLTASANGDSLAPVVDADGSFVVFTSTATNLTGAATTGGLSQVYLWSRANPSALRLISTGASGAGNGASTHANLALYGKAGSDGRSIAPYAVAFDSTATNLDAADTDAGADVYRVTNLDSTATVSLASRNTSGARANGASTYPALSADGSKLVFRSLATDLVTGVTDSNSASDIFLRDFATATNQLISVSLTPPGVAAGVTTTEGGVASVSPEGRFVGFDSRSRDVVVGEAANDNSDVFLRDRRQAAPNSPLQGLNQRSLAYSGTTVTEPSSTVFTSSSPPSYSQLLNEVVLPVGWKDLENQDGSNPWGVLKSTTPVDDALTALRAYNAANPTLPKMRLRLRVFAGACAPYWVRGATSASGVGSNGFSLTFTTPAGYACSPDGALGLLFLPLWWSAQTKTAYDVLQANLAAKYDSEPLLAEVTSGRCMTIFVEPFIRQAYSTTNRAEIWDAGLQGPGGTSGIGLDERCYREQIDSHSVWTRVRSSLALNPYQEIPDRDPPPPPTENWRLTERIADYCRSVLGEYCVLGNNSARRPDPVTGQPAYGNGTTSRLADEYTYPYAKIRQLGAPIYFQTAVAASLGAVDGSGSPSTAIADILTALHETLLWAQNQGASSVEIPNARGSWETGQNPSPQDVNDTPGGNYDDHLTQAYGGP